MTAEQVVDVLDALAAAQVDVVVGGGWGVDALLGRETRRHDDLDVAVPAERLDAAASVLGRLGYVPVEDARPARLVLATPTGRVDLHPVIWDADGNGTQEGVDGQTFRYPAGSVRSEGLIGGRQVRCCSPELQLELHAGYEPRDRDRHDVRGLSERFDLPVPDGYREG